VPGATILKAFPGKLRRCIPLPNVLSVGPAFWLALKMRSL